MDKTVIIKQREFYTNTMVAFVLLQGMGYCYDSGSNELFNRSVKNVAIFPTDYYTFCSAAWCLVLGSITTFYLKTHAEKLTKKPNQDLGVTSSWQNFS